MGEVTVNILGLNESKYQWVIDALEDEKRQKAQKELEESQRRMLRAQERERKAAQRRRSRSAGTQTAPREALGALTGGVCPRGVFFSWGWCAGFEVPLFS